ncbi:peptidase inhibitor family I36 protein [Streptomyces sp. NPDC048290]|uniref:peptidase inhibitor family I36 protein n=1 Tax=Streptomyces sp. NPDC048290 TaxID=3155811 RepID=UPI0034343514
MGTNARAKRPVHRLMGTAVTLTALGTGATLPAQAAPVLAPAAAAGECALGQWKVGTGATLYREIIVHTTHVFAVSSAWNTGCMPAPIGRTTGDFYWLDRSDLWGKGWVLSAWDESGEVEKTFLRMPKEPNLKQAWTDRDDHLAAWRTYSSADCPADQLCLYKGTGHTGDGVRFVDAPDVTQLDWWDINDEVVSYRNNTTHDFCWYEDFRYEGAKGLWKAGTSLDQIPEDQKATSSIAPARTDSDGNPTC